MLGRLSIALLLVIAAVGGVVYERNLVPKGTTVSFLSVGQGDCTLFMSDGWTVLVDVGPKTPLFDGGERLVVPELRRQGVRKIDCIIITHSDADHVGGLEAVASKYRIGKVLVSSAFRDDESLLARFAAAELEESQIVWVEASAQATLGNLSFTLITPEFEPESSTNERSMFVRLDAGSGSVALSGDAGTEEEKSVGNSLDWDVDLLLAGHHGSKSSTGSFWLSATSPDTVITSCGRRNRYGHPSEEMVSRVNAYGSELLRTDLVGTITYVLTENGFERLNLQTDFSAR